MSFPDIVAIGKAYGIPSYRIDNHDFAETMHQVLASEGPVLCEVQIDPEQPSEPKLGSRQLPDGSIVTAPLEDMSPLLDRQELARNMLIPLEKEDP